MRPDFPAIVATLQDGTDLSPWSVARAYVHAIPSGLRIRCGLDAFDRFDGEAFVPQPHTMRDLADTMEAARHTPNDPATRAAYASLCSELGGQFEALLAAGYRFHTWENEGQPYDGSAAMIADVRDRKRLDYFPTVAGFGEDGVPDSHPLLTPSVYRDSDGRPMLWNDVLRCVHDVFGHAAHGFSFSASGEFKAWAAHAVTFTASARLALAAETLLQNAWVNFGPHLRREDGTIPARGEAGYIAPSVRPYAEQKAFTAPDAFRYNPADALSRFHVARYRPSSRRY